MQNLRANTMEEMRQLLQHLSLPGDEARLACIQRSLQPRQPRLGGDGDPYTRAQHRRMDLAIDQANRVLEEAGGRGLPLDLYPLYHNYENIGTGATFVRGHQSYRDTVPIKFSK